MRCVGLAPDFFSRPSMLIGFACWIDLLGQLCWDRSAVQLLPFLFTWCLRNSSILEWSNRRERTDGRVSFGMLHVVTMVTYLQINWNNVLFQLYFVFVICAGFRTNDLGNLKKVNKVYQIQSTVLPHFTYSECVFVCADPVALGGVMWCPCCQVRVWSSICVPTLRLLTLVAVFDFGWHSTKRKNMFFLCDYFDVHYLKEMIRYQNGLFGCQFEAMSSWIVCMSIVDGGSPRCVWWVISDSLIVVWRLCHFTQRELFWGWKTLLGIVSSTYSVDQALLPSPVSLSSCELVWGLGLRLDGLTLLAP